jgi:hypothetical protein
MNLQHAALQLAERDLAVFPCLPHDKRPATPHGVKDATTCADTVARWWRQDPNFNIGLACGAISNIWATDIDGLDAEAELRKLEAQHSALPATVESITARGRHLFFKWPDQDIRNSAGKLAPGIDIRGNGGYVVVPPSLHPSGKRYTWSVDSASAFAPAPAWLLNKITAPARSPSLAPVEWCELIADGVSEGHRNDSLARLTGHLLRHRVDPLVTLELIIAVNDARCRPPLSRAEVRTVVNSIAARELKRRLGQ